jgi:protease I
MSIPPVKAAILVTDDYEDLEFWYPVLRLREAGVEVVILGPSSDATYYSRLGYPVIPDTSIADAGGGFDLLVVPGGGAAEKLATDPAALALTAALAGQGSQIVTIGAGAQVPTAAGVPSYESYENADGLPKLFQKLLAVR